MTDHRTSPQPTDDPIDVQVVEVPVPASLDSPDAWAVHGSALVEAAMAMETHGHTDLALDAGRAWSSMLDQDYDRVVRLVAVRDGLERPESVVGRAMVGMPQVGNVHTAVVFVGVHPQWRRRGIGSTLWAAVLDLVRSHGRTVLRSDSAYADEPPPGPGALESPTGSGRVPVDSDATRFALQRGFALEQVDRQSTLELPVPPERLAALHRDAAATAGDDYRVHVWDDEVPDRWLDAFAELETRMSTDAPHGGLELAEDRWDAARVRAAEAEIHARGDRYLVAVVEHVPTGVLAAFSMADYPADLPEVAFQQDTLVRSDHRGHRLGMLVKTALLAALADVRPTARRLHTWNAQENAHMLAINVALGFRPASVEAHWQVRL